MIKGTLFLSHRFFPVRFLEELAARFSPALADTPCQIFFYTQASLFILLWMVEVLLLNLWIWLLFGFILLFVHFHFSLIIPSYVIATHTITPIRYFPIPELSFSSPQRHCCNNIHREDPLRPCLLLTEL